MTLLDSPSTVIGPFVVGEKPPPLVYQFLDANGVAIVLTGYAVRFIVRDRDSGVTTTYNGTLLDGPTGKVQYTLTGAEFAAPGHYLCEFWVGNTVQRYASVTITAAVRGAYGPVPAI